MPKPANKPAIAIDIDDVLAANAEGFVEFSNRRWGTTLTSEDYDEHWAQVWRVNDEEAEERAQKYAASGTHRHFKKITGADKALMELAKGYKLVVVTSRRRAMEKDNQDWLDEHFPGVFTEVHYAGIWDKMQSGRINITKAETVREIGADYLIDDQLKHCISAAEAGIKALLFGDYSWNQTSSLPEGVTRVKDWKAVLEYFNEK